MWSYHSGFSFFTQAPSIFIDFFETLPALAHSYISDFSVMHAPVCALRTLDRDVLSVQGAPLKNKRLKHLAPRLWNDLPEEIRLAKLVIFLISCLWHTLFCILTCFSIVFMAFNLTYLLILTECKFAFKMIFSFL